ncbi:hypothetical protein RSPO_c01407 [Ralstonia solanacearum Po82]|uniref:Uncharacterized protein n=1 Tax=Ralstonia solanacearum (strain Po82) TaxID=1031711 RepID=F6G0C4_RALS8|nr:hypothetical protein RSPO_c01407 [Ralstonia solanacearum Po82]
MWGWGLGHVFAGILSFSFPHRPSNLPDRATSSNNRAIVLPQRWFFFAPVLLRRLDFVFLQFGN